MINTRSNSKEVGPRTSKLVLLLIKFMKFLTVQFFVIRVCRRKSKLRINTKYSSLVINFMNKRHAFVQFSYLAKNWHFCTPIINCQYFYTPTLDPKSFDIQRILWKCSKCLWLQKLDHRLGCMCIMKKSLTNFGNSTQKFILMMMTLFIIQEPVWNDVITTEMKSTGIHLLNYYSFKHIYSTIKLTGPNCRSWS